MPYLVESSVMMKVGGEEQYLALTDSASLSNVPSTLKSLYLDQVDSLFDGYAKGGGYDTPLTDDADIGAIQAPLLAIANWILKTRGGREASDDDKLEYQNAMQFLKDVQSGKIILPSGGATSDDTVADAGLDSETRLFDRCTLRVL